MLCIDLERAPDCLLDWRHHDSPSGELIGTQHAVRPPHLHHRVHLFGGDNLVGEGRIYDLLVEIEDPGKGDRTGIRHVPDPGTFRLDESQGRRNEVVEELSGQGFLDSMEQAAGRLVHDLTVTKVNLFHIAELRVGVLNHRPYNIGWGHHHCNVVVKDSGLDKTLEWMKQVVDRNTSLGYLPAASNKGR